ncbi:MAG: diadenylate cyclase CdaA [Oscillospiraceae bacterium]|nr:diadenylate cyclase CdaA [Oscillospiraceae bacterium]
MNTFFETLSNSIRYIRTIGIADAIDILIVALLIFEVLRLIRRTNSGRVAAGILLLVVLLWISEVVKLTMINFLLSRAMELGFLALIIIFQPELRRVLEKVGSSSRIISIFGRDISSLNMESVITQTALACADMSAAKTGALIIFVRDNQLADPISTGTLVDAAVTSELLKNLFFKNSPLHDGAVIIKDGRIAAAGCMLPMSNNMNLSKDLGMRHRAGIGISEQSDAVVVIVSEETGSISVAEDGMLKRHLSSETMETLLRKELMTEEAEPGKRPISEWLRSKLDLRKKEQ